MNILMMVVVTMVMMKLIFLNHNEPFTAGGVSRLRLHLVVRFFDV